MIIDFRQQHFETVKFKMICYTIDKTKETANIIIWTQDIVQTIEQKE